MKIKLLAVVLFLSLGCSSIAAWAKETKDSKKSDSWNETLKPADKEFLSTGRNPYWILEPGYELVLEGKEDGKATRLVVTVLDETKKVDGVETRIVEERESQDGKVIEISRNYFAIGKETKNLYYFGEEVDMYKNGKITSHEGAWESGVDGAKFGIMIPGKPEVGARYYAERAPKVAMDRGENVSTNETLKTPAGTFKNCLKVVETTPLEPDTTEYKIYAPDIGIVKDGSLLLVKKGMATKK